MVSPLDVAWSVLKAGPEDSLYTEEVSRVGSGAYGDPMLTPAVVQNRFQTMHPAIRGMMQRRLQYSLTPRQKHMGRIEGYGASNVPYNTPENVAFIEDVPTIDMPYYIDEGMMIPMGGYGDVRIRSGTGAPEHLPLDTTRLPSFNLGHDFGTYLESDHTRGGRYPTSIYDDGDDRRPGQELNVFRDEGITASALANQGRRSLAETENFADNVYMRGGQAPYTTRYRNNEIDQRFSGRGYGRASDLSPEPDMDYSEFGRSIFDYDMRNEL